VTVMGIGMRMPLCDKRTRPPLCRKVGRPLRPLGILRLRLPYASQCEWVELRDGALHTVAAPGGLSGLSAEAWVEAASLRIAGVEHAKTTLDPVEYDWPIDRPWSDFLPQFSELAWRAVRAELERDCASDARTGALLARLDRTCTCLAFHPAGDARVAELAIAEELFRALAAENVHARAAFMHAAEDDDDFADVAVAVVDVQYDDKLDALHTLLAIASRLSQHGEAPH